MRNIRVPVVGGLVDMTSGFRTKKRPNHHGVDFFPSRRGTKLPVLSFDDGVVVLIQRGHRTSGNWIEIWQDDGLTLSYKHLDSIDMLHNQRVRRGQQIGIMGRSGDATQVHLHLEARHERQNNAGRNAFDPWPMILTRMIELEREARNMNIAQRPSPNHSLGRQGHIPDIIVNHITEGAFPGSIYWAINPDSGISYHFLVSRTGEITQCVAIENMAWANGTGNNGDRRDNKHSRLAVVRNRRVNANLFSISIGHEGRHDETQGALTAEQQAATIWLKRHIREEVRRIWGITIPFTRDTIVGHVDITPINAPICPGERFPFDDIIRILNNGAVPAQISTSNTEPVSSMPQVSQSSDGLLRVRVGPFPNRKEADVVRKKLKKLGNRDIKKPFPLEDGGTWWTQATATSSREGAERVAQILRSQNLGGVVIV